MIIKESWPVPAIFPFLREAGEIDEGEMLRTFNAGIGMAAIVPAGAAREACAHLSSLGEQAYEIGRVIPCGHGEENLTFEE